MSRGSNKSRIQQHGNKKAYCRIPPFILMCAATAKSLQLCPTLCDPIDGSPPGSPVPGILQARTLEWVAISFSNTWKWKVKGKLLSRVQPLAWTAAHQAPPSMGFSRQEYKSGVPLNLVNNGGIGGGGPTACSLERSRANIIKYYHLPYAKCCHCSNTAWFHLHRVPRIVKFIELESILVDAMGWR